MRRDLSFCGLSNPHAFVLSGEVRFGPRLGRGQFDSTGKFCALHGRHSLPGTDAGPDQSCAVSEYRMREWPGSFSRCLQNYGMAVRRFACPRPCKSSARGITVLPRLHRQSDSEHEHSQWKKAVLTAFAHYGGYVGSTGLSGQTLNPYLESAEAYSYKGVSDPFPKWAASQSGVVNVGCNSSDCRYTFPFLDKVPWVNGPTCPSNLYAGGCDLSHHMHIASPCVAAGLANQPANAATAPCVWPLTLKSSGNGSVAISMKGSTSQSTSLLYFGKESPVTLTAKPGTNSTFGGWGGACSGTNLSCNVTVSQATTVTASFQ